MADVPPPQRSGSTKSSLDEKAGDVKPGLADHVEDAAPEGPQGATPTEIQARFPLLRDLSEAQMEALNNKMVKKIDWRLMPCVTAMFLMKYDLGPCLVTSVQHANGGAVTSTASTCRMRALLACRKTSA